MYIVYKVKYLSPQPLQQLMSISSLQTTVPTCNKTKNIGHCIEGHCKLRFKNTKIIRLPVEKYTLKFAEVKMLL